MTTTCSLPTCKEPAAIELQADDGWFAFCADHAPVYEAMGYKPRAQAELAGTRDRAE